MLKKFVKMLCLIEESAYVIVYEWSNRKTNPSLPNLATAKEVTKKTEIKRKAFSRLFDFLEHYGEKVLDKLLPEVAMKAVKTFSRGTKALLADMKEYSWVNHVLTETSDWQKACLTLSRRQLEVNK
jgi:hypothetical protein